jgi:hypothetical protein
MVVEMRGVGIVAYGVWLREARRLARRAMYVGLWRMSGG